MTVRTLGADDLEPLLDLWQVAFGRNDPASRVGRRDWFLRHPEWVRGAFVEGRLAAVARCYPFEMFWGVPVRLGGIASVATAVEHRHAGLARALMTDALRGLREAGVGWSALWPFSGPFYRRLGWERCHADLTCEGALADLPRGGPVQQAELRPTPELWVAYSAWATRWNGTLARSPEWWERRLANFGVPSLAYEVPGRGFLHLQLEAGEPGVRILDLFWRDAEAGRSLLGCLRGFAAQASRWTWRAPWDAALLEDDACNRTARPGMMLRVVDVPAALAALRPSGSGRLRLRVADDVLEWNDGDFEVEWQDGQASVARTDRQADLRLDVRALAQVLSGYLRPETAWKDGRAEGDLAALRSLAGFAGGRTTHCADYF